jgi:hypothetical protein
MSRRLAPVIIDLTTGPGQRLIPSKEDPNVAGPQASFRAAPMIDKALIVRGFSI